jgi:hypothetical protein
MASIEFSPLSRKRGRVREGGKPAHCQPLSLSPSPSPACGGGEK